MWANIVTATLTLFAAFIGAYSAFKLEATDRRRREIRTEIGAGNRALFTLIRFWNDLAVIRHQTITPLRNHPGRAIVIRPLAAFKLSSLSIDVSELTFLFTQNEGTLLSQLLVEEDRFHSLALALRQRSSLHSDVVQPALARAGIEEGCEYDRERFRAALGDHLLLTIERLTDEIIEHLDQTLHSISETVDELRNTLLRLYPGESFASFEPNPEYL